MRVLVACEFSGIVRDAFAARGHDAWSCDLLLSESPGNHLQMDNDMHLKDTLYDRRRKWDLVIAHPPCTHLSVSGAKHFEKKRSDGSQQQSIMFFMMIADCPVDKVCIENPVSIMSTVWRKPDQIIQPWQFGHGETKATCLWLKNLPKLKHFAEVDLFNDIITHVKGREQRIHKMTPGPNRAKDRSRTYEGIAKAMAAQWC